MVGYTVFVVLNYCYHSLEHAYTLMVRKDEKELKKKVTLTKTDDSSEKVLVSVPNSNTNVTIE